MDNLNKKSLKEEPAEEFENKMCVAFVACEECKFTVEFDFDNKTFFFCKKDLLGANLPTVQLESNFFCNRCESLMRRYDLYEEDNVCPICNSYLSVCYGKNEAEREKARRMFLSEQQRAQASTGKYNVLSIKLVDKKDSKNKQNQENDKVSTSDIGELFKVGLTGDPKHQSATAKLLSLIKPQSKNNEENTSPIKRVGKIKKEYLLISSLVLLIALLFYWFLYRPSSIRKSCVEEVKSKYSILAWSNRYRLCLVEHGLKPESLFVNTE